MAGLVIGIIGLVGTALFWAAAATVTVGVRDINQALTPKTVRLRYGEEVTFPSQAITVAPPGVLSITVEGLTYPVSSQDSLVQPEAGKEFAVATVRECAGASGAQESLSDLGFTIFFPGGVSVEPFFGNAKTPGLGDINALGSGQCATGNITFDIASGTTPTGVEYEIGLPNRTYLWTP